MLAKLRIKQDQQAQSSQRKSYPGEIWSTFSLELKSLFSTQFQKLSKAKQSIDFRFISRSSLTIGKTQWINLITCSTHSVSHS